jgi:hypothetical protein
MTEDEKHVVSTVTGAVSHVATTAIDSLRNQPGLLIIAFLNALVFALLYFGVTNTNARRDEHLMRVIDSCLLKRMGDAEL